MDRRISRIHPVLPAFALHLPQPWSRPRSDPNPLLSRRRYNHFGPDGAYVSAFSPYYFSQEHDSPWGAGVNLDGPESDVVRDFFVENALHWVNEYHLDGLRLDAAHELHDDSDRHFLAELVGRIRAGSARPVWIAAEDERNDATLIRPQAEGGFGLDAVWADDFHHHVRRAAVGDDEGYFANFSGTMADLAATIRQGWFFTGQVPPLGDEARGTDPSGLRPAQFIVCLQNHDQVGNRAFGERLHHQVDPAT